MVDIIAYVRSLIFPTADNISRKRRAPLEDYELPVTAKMRKTGTSPLSSGEDDWLSSSPTNTITHRRSVRNSNANPLWSKDNPTVVIDDDDIVEINTPYKQQINLNKSFRKSPRTSTPRTNLLVNGNDDVTFLKSTQSLSERKLDAKKKSLDYVKPFSYLADNHVKENGTKVKNFSIRNKENGTKVRDFSLPIFKRALEVREKLGLNKCKTRSTALAHSYRLDEKEKFQALIAQAVPNSQLTGSFSKYSTPTGKLFAYGTSSRGKKMVELAANTKPKSSVLIDLTGSDLDKRSKLSTKDTIQKVLDNFEDAVIIKDSDSDLEILPTPPSPKPDIKVPRTNSFKKTVDSREAASHEWLQNLILRHRKIVTKFEKEISAKAAHTEKLKEITTEIHTQRLGDQLAKYLYIKDAVLPIHVPDEVVFPPLSEDDEAQIDIALNRRASLNEVVSSKFNLRITRRDILTLSGLNWLNDEVINFYMNMIIERGKIPKRPKVYAMNTFFYPKLLKDGHNSLRRWTRRIDIFSYELIAVPIHLGVHWCMSIVDFCNKTITYYDSMGSKNDQCLSALRNYLVEEHLDKRQCEFNTSGWKLENVRDVPHQMNGSDCGMFACSFAEVLTRRGRITFSQEDMPYLRRKMVLEILNGELLIQ